MSGKLRIQNSNGKYVNIEHTDNSNKDINLVAEKITQYVDTIEELEQLDNANTGDVILVKDKDRGGIFIYDEKQGSVNDGGVVFNGWVRQFSGPVNIKWFGAKGDGETDDTEILNKCISVANSPINIIFSNGNFIIDYSNVETLGKHITFISNNGKINNKIFSSFNFRDPNNGNSQDNEVVSQLDDTIFTKYESISDISNAGNSEFYGYYFSLSSDGQSDEPVRGVIGNVFAKGDTAGEFKAIRVGAHDETDNGCKTVMAFSGSISPTENTSNAIVMQLSHQPTSGIVSDKTTFIRMETWDYRNRIQNGIVFDQNLEFNDAVIQAGMGSNSSDNAKFLKLKKMNDDGTINSISFSVDKEGNINTIGEVTVGDYAPLIITKSGIKREVDGANIAIDTTGVLFFNINGVTVAKISDGKFEVDASNINFSNLPTSDPGVAGQLWNDNGTLKISAG